MKLGASVLLAVIVVWAMAPAVEAQENAMNNPDFVVMPHMKGTLALQVSSIASMWYVPAADGKEARLRVVSPVLTDAKSLAGDAATAMWSSFEGRDDFLTVAHMGGTLAIPRAQIRTAYFTDDGAPRLRLTYDGDPSGKTLEGDEAARVWAALQR